MKLKMYLRMLLAAVAALFVATACDDSDDKTEPGGPGAEEVPLTFEIAVSNIEGSRATLSVTPNDQMATYYWSAVKKSIYDGLGSDEAFLEDDQAFIQRDAKANQMTLTAYLQWVTGRGTATYTLTGLEAYTEYYAYVYGIKTDGTVTSGVTKVLFTSGEGGDGPDGDSSFNITISNIGAIGATANVVPEDQASYYWLCMLNDSQYQQYKNQLAEVITEDILDMKEFVEEYYNQTFDMAEIIGAFGYQGDQAIDLSGLYNMSPETTYHVFVAGVDETTGDLMTSVAEADPFTTIAAGNGPEITMSLRAGNSSGANTHNSLYSMITAPNKDVTLCKLYTLTTAELESSGKTPAELVSIKGELLPDEGVEMINDQGCGITVGESKLSANTSYTVITLVANAEGRVTVVTRTATTTEGSGGGETSEGPFEITISNITSSGATASVIPEDKDSYYWLTLLPANYYEQYKSQLASYIEEEIAYIHESVGVDKYTIEQIVTILGYQGDQNAIDLSESANMDPETTYYVFAAGVDPSTGKVTTDVAVADPFTTLAAGDGPEFKLELVAGDSNGANTDTKAMLIVEAPNADIASGYRVLAETSQVESLLAQGATLEQLVTSDEKYAFSATHLEYINEGGLGLTYYGLSPETSYTAIVLLANAAGGKTVQTAKVTTTAALGDPTEVEVTTLTKGSMIHYGDAYGLPNNDYANWTVYLAASTVDLEAFSGTGDLLMLELNTAKSVTTGITPGTYTIGGRTSADFKAFTCVPGYIVSERYAYGTWFGSADKGYSNPMSSGTVVVSKTDNTYTFTFELLDASANKIFKGTFTGELTYKNSSQTSAPAKALGKDAVRKMVAIEEVMPASLSAGTFVMSRKIASANLLACGLKSRGAVAEFRCMLSEEPEVNSAFGLRKFSAVGLMGERKTTVKVRTVRNE